MGPECGMAGAPRKWNSVRLTTMEEIMDPFRQRFVDAFHSLKIGHSCATHALCRPEFVEQGLLPPHAHACNLIQWVLPDQRS